MIRPRPTFCAALMVSVVLVSSCSRDADEETPTQQAAPAQADPAAGRERARSCNACHSPEGNAAHPDTPLLAGQHQDYLVQALRAYQDGSRAEETMHHIRAPLAETDIQNLAAYYASLPGRWGTPEQDGGKPVTPYQDPVDAGASAAASCGGCHGADGNSPRPGMPSLTGQHPAYLAAATRAYVGGDRQDTMMSAMVATLTAADLENIALHYAVQRPKRSAATAEGNAVAGEALSASCNGCHGERGVSSAEDTPSLAGQDPQYLIKATAAYRDGHRGHELMRSAAATLDDKAIQDIAAYYVAQPPAQAKFHRPLSPAEWATRCDRCHGSGGLGDANTGVPRLAGQKVEYLHQALHAYEAGGRKSGTMHAMTASLSEGEREGLARFYAYRQTGDIPQ